MAGSYEDAQKAYEEAQRKRDQQRAWLNQLIETGQMGAADGKLKDYGVDELNYENKLNQAKAMLAQAQKDHDQALSAMNAAKPKESTAKGGAKSQDIIDMENEQRRKHAAAGHGTVTDKEYADQQRATANTQVAQQNSAQAGQRNTQQAQQNALNNTLRGQQLQNTSTNLAIQGARVEETAIKNQADALYHAGLLSNQRRTQIGKEAETEYKGTMDGIKVVVDAGKAAMQSQVQQRQQDASMANARLGFTKSLFTSVIPIVGKMMMTLPKGSTAAGDFLIAILAAANTTAKEMGGLRELAHVSIPSNILKVAGYDLPDKLPTFPTAAELDWRTAVSLAASGMPPVGWRGPIGVEALTLARQRPQEAKRLAENVKLPNQDSQGKPLPGNSAVKPEQLKSYVEKNPKVYETIVQQESGNTRFRQAAANIQKAEKAGQNPSQADLDVISDTNLRVEGRLQLAASGRPWNTSDVKDQNKVPVPSNIGNVIGKVDPELRPLAAATYALALQKQASGQPLTDQEKILAGAVTDPGHKQALLEAWSPQRLQIAQRMLDNSRNGRGINEGLTPEEVKSVGDGYQFSSSRLAGRWVDDELKPGPNGAPPPRPADVPPDWKYVFKNGVGTFYDPKNPNNNTLEGTPKGAATPAPTPFPTSPKNADGTPGGSRSTTMITEPPLTGPIRPGGDQTIQNTIQGPPPWIDQSKKDAVIAGGAQPPTPTGGALQSPIGRDVQDVIQAAIKSGQKLPEGVTDDPRQVASLLARAAREGKNPVDILATELGTTTQALRQTQKQFGVHGDAKHPDDIIQNFSGNQGAVPPDAQVQKPSPATPDFAPQLPGSGPTQQNLREMNVGATIAKLNESLGPPDPNSPEALAKRKQEAEALVDAGKGAMAASLPPVDASVPVMPKPSEVQPQETNPAVGFEGMTPEQARDKIYDVTGTADLVALIQSGQKAREELTPIEKHMLELAEDKVRLVTAALKSPSGDNQTAPANPPALDPSIAGGGQGAEKDIASIYGGGGPSDWLEGMQRRKQAYDSTFGNAAWQYEPSYDDLDLSGGSINPDDGYISLDGSSSGSADDSEPQDDGLWAFTSPNFIPSYEEDDEGGDTMEDWLNF